MCSFLQETWKKSISKFHFPVKSYEIRKNVIIQNSLLQKDLKVWIATKNVYFSLYLNKNDWNPKIQFFNRNI